MMKLDADEDLSEKPQSAQGFPDSGVIISVLSPFCNAEFSNWSSFHFIYCPRPLSPQLLWCVTCLISLSRSRSSVLHLYSHSHIWCHGHRAVVEKKAQFIHLHSLSCFSEAPVLSLKAWLPMVQYLKES